MTAAPDHTGGRAGAGSRADRPPGLCPPWTSRHRGAERPHRQGPQDRADRHRRVAPGGAARAQRELPPPWIPTRQRRLAGLAVQVRRWSARGLSPRERPGLWQSGTGRRGPRRASRPARTQGWPRSVPGRRAPAPRGSPASPARRCGGKRGRQGRCRRQPWRWRWEAPGTASRHGWGGAPCARGGPMRAGALHGAAPSWRHRLLYGGCRRAPGTAGGARGGVSQAPGAALDGAYGADPSHVCPVAGAPGGGGRPPGALGGSAPARRGARARTLGRARGCAVARAQSARAGGRGPSAGAVCLPARAAAGALDAARHGVVALGAADGAQRAGGFPPRRGQRPMVGHGTPTGGSKMDAAHASVESRTQPVCHFVRGAGARVKKVPHLT
jgi:hypothetical protein